MASDWEKAHEAYVAYEKQVSAMLRKERRAIATELLSFSKTTLQGMSGVVVAYFPYPLWLYRFDPEMKRELDVNIRSFRYQRDKHKDDTVALLTTITRYRTGGALLDDIGASGKELSIVPFWKFGKTGYKNDNPFFASLGLNASAMPLGKKDANGMSDAAIQFTATMWGPRFTDPDTHRSTGTAGYTGPATGMDEVLFHEMIHGDRFMHGVSDDSTAVDQGYVNEEEYIAVVLSNIYLAEKGQRIFRADHSGFSVLHRPEDFLKNAQRVNLSPRKLIAKFRGQHPKMFRELARIPERDARWNPIREYAKEKGLVP